VKPDKIKVYALEIILLAILSFTLFVSKVYSRIVLACLLTVCAVATSILLKKRNTVSVHAKKVNIILAIFAIIYLAGFYVMGLHFGYYRAILTFSYTTLIQHIIPIAVIIISSEMMRNILLAQNTKFTKLITFIVMVIIDMLIYANLYNADTYDEIVELVGFALFAALACNLFYNYITVRFGIVGNIIFRLITILYAYIIPIIPNVVVLFRSILRIIYPYVMYLVIDYTFQKEEKAEAYEKKRKSTVGHVVLFILIVVFMAIVSCQFTYGIVVIATGSMTGTINIGDAVLFEKYDGKELIEVGDVIIFNKQNMKIAHRVIDIKIVNGEKRYITKGDANKDTDQGYITNSDVYGMTKLRIPYIGYPTVLLRDIISK